MLNDLCSFKEKKMKRFVNFVGPGEVEEGDAASAFSSFY